MAGSLIFGKEGFFDYVVHDISNFLTMFLALIRLREYWL